MRVKRSGYLKRRKPMRKRMCDLRLPKALKSRKAIKPKRQRSAEDERAEFEREFGSEARIEWIRWHGCIGCARTPCENHHTKNGGRGRRADACWIVPACFACHTEIHANGVQTFEAAHADMLSGLTLKEWAQRYEASWRAFSGESAA